MFAVSRDINLSALDITCSTPSSAPHDVDPDFISVLIFP